MSGMHLLPVYYSTTNTRKRKQKKKSASVLEAERQHAKFLKKMGIGKSKAGVVHLHQSRSVGKPGNPSALGAENRKFESYRSDQFYNKFATKKEPNIYTGTEIIGIAQMHKSNAIPIRNKEQAIEVARMRRG